MVPVLLCIGYREVGNAMLISVFTPTYNRAMLIHRVYESLNKQDFTDFEWIIIDDGSSDGTEEIIETFRSTARYPIKFLKQENKGKARSINVGLDLAGGELFICFDSDDWCVPNALSRIAEVWAGLTVDERASYSGISCLKALRDGSTVGEDYARMNTKGESYIDRFNKRIRGDKWEVLRTDLHRAARYELFGDERYMAPSYAWLEIGKTHKTLFLNEALSIVEYQAEGISKNNLAHRVSSPVSTARVYFLAWSVSNNLASRFRSAVNYYRFNFHARRPSKLTFVFQLTALLPGWLLYCRDCYLLKNKLMQ